MVADETKPTPRQEIRNLLSVVIGSIVFGLVFAGIVLYYYGPTGRYYVRNVLLDPAFLSTLSYDDINPKTGGNARYVFSGIDYSYYDAEQKRLHHVSVPEEIYKKFYEQIADERSLTSISDQIAAQFNQPYASKLILNTRANGNQAADAASKVFLQVQFVNDGDYYRVQLRDNTSGETWAYYYHPHIYSESFQLFSRAP